MEPQDERDERLEERLRALRPIGPPSPLRARVIRAAHARSARQRWIWVPAAAAVLGALLLNWHTARSYDALARSEARAAESQRQRDIERLGVAWGGTPASRAAAKDAFESIDDASHARAHTITAEGTIE